MTTKRIAWIAPDINEYTNSYGTTFYVNCSFDDLDSGSIGKKTLAAAEQVKALLTAIVDQEAEFGLESTGKKNKDGDKWKILSFPGYEAPQRPGEKDVRAVGEVISKPSPLAAAPLSFYSDRDAEIRAAVALKAAVEFLHKEGVGAVLVYADEFYDWLSERPGRTTNSGSNGAPTAPRAVGHGTHSPAGPDSSSAPRSGNEARRSEGGNEVETGADSSSPPSAATPLAANTPSGGPSSAPGDHSEQDSRVTAEPSQDPGADDVDAEGGAQAAPAAKGKRSKPSASAQRCAHLKVSDLNPAGEAMPNGLLRCEGCNKTFKESDLR